jgi:thymidylate synthase
MSFENGADYSETLKPDDQYKELLQRIIDEGETARSGMDEESRQILGHVMRFDMRNGFPMITERDLLASMKTDPADHETTSEARPFTMSARQGLGEIIGFINGARTLDQLEQYGNKWWKYWATDEKCQKRGLEPGDLGPGSYGAAFHDYPDGDGRPFNQFEQVIQQVRERPELRTHLISPIIPPYTIRTSERTQKVVVVPCHGDLRFDVNTETGMFDLVHKQRSADVPVGLPFNMIHYGAIMSMFGRATGYQPRELVYMLDNAHMYRRHYQHAEEILLRPTKPFPRLLINSEIDDFFDYRVHDFMVEDYEPHPPMDMGGTPV